MALIFQKAIETIKNPTPGTKLVSHGFKTKLKEAVSPTPPKADAQVVSEAFAIPIEFLTPASIPLVEPEALTEQQVLVNEFITLYKKFESIDGKNLVKRLDDIKKALQTVANDTMDKDQPATFTGPLGSMTFSPRGKDTDVPDPGALLTHLTEKFDATVALSVVSIKLGELRKLLGEIELKPFIKEEPGSRNLKLVQPAAQAKA